MHDDTALTLGRASRVLRERIIPAVHSASRPLEVAAHELPGEPIPPEEGLRLEFSPYTVGTPWGPAWGTTWFRVRATVPKDWAGRQVEIAVDLGFDTSRTGFQCEALVHRPDGTPLKALNPQSQHATVLDEARGGEKIELFLEAAANPEIHGSRGFVPTWDGDIRTSSTDPLYVTRRMDLAVFEPEVHGLALDVQVLLELAEQLPEGRRRHRILESLDHALDVLDLQDIPGTAAGARTCLVEPLSSPAETSAHTVSAVGHAHIDSAWLWPIRETIRKVARTTTSMAELIDRTDDFLYGMSSAQQYAWIKEHRPRVWQRVRAAVAKGRFLPLGGMWVESDVVMPTGESIVRQFSQGQRFFEREFGIRCKGVWLPDSFGYSPSLPQLMRRSGFEWFFTQKISWNQVNVFPHHTFAWEGIDGSRILSHFPPMDTYNAQLSGEELAKATSQFRESRRASGSIAPVGYGDGGGGTTREMVGRSRRLSGLEGSAVVRWEHPDDFFDRAQEELPDPPVWVGELYLEIHRATLTSQHRTKQGNRRSEHLLIEAELWAATAAVRTGAEYPYAELDELWQLTLLHQFHDILPGTSIAWVHREAQAAYEQIQERAEALISDSLASLVGPGDVPLEANSTPFKQPGLPALAVGAPQQQATPVQLTQLDDGAVELRNDQVAVTITGAGHIRSARDLATGRESVAPGKEAGVLQLHQDFPNKWDAWDVDRFYRNRVTELRDVSSFAAEVTDDGTAVVSVERRFSTSSLVQRLILEPGSRTLRIEQSTDWRETEKFLKVAFPLDVRAEHTAAETQYGFQRRVTHTNTSWEAAKFETSMHRFVLAEEPGFGVALVNDSIYGYDVTRDVHDADITTTVRLSLLRAPRFPDPETDQGVQTHVYGMVIGADVADATKAGIEMNLPRRRISGRSGVSPLVRCTGEGVVISSVKLADDRSGDLIVRVYEALGRRADGTVFVDAPVLSVRDVSLIEDDLDQGVDAEGSVDVTLRPFEVRTLRFTRA
ncbi:glycoside hydrolase family 38 C-terminal domain-containing protein [Nesterenkonia sp. CL21]|uniref:alpha-mannosidase n=1 Tax=Nesterenkonia sp. CL21 TaxID=3064894 RepID=UPI0028790B32|nr:glycoside hydrolase family 38 C-terminal domain-containing protein [Nesterenkonia sp. CL21]MDS2173396.1 glycoside hydrolase family 38 C-terminal domain-containing protein [Nesterenkonia sp. CL21]